MFAEDGQHYALVYRLKVLINKSCSACKENLILIIFPLTRYIYIKVWPEIYQHFSTESVSYIFIWNAVHFN